MEKSEKNKGFAKDMRNDGGDIQQQEWTMLDRLTNALMGQHYTAFFRSSLAATLVINLLGYAGGLYDIRIGFLCAMVIYITIPSLDYLVRRNGKTLPDWLEIPAVITITYLFSASPFVLITIINGYS